MKTHLRIARDRGRPESTIHRTALSSAIVAALAATGAGPVAAQEQAQLEEVVVTGTRIRRTDGMAEPTPVTTLTPVELSTFEPGSTVAEQLDALPQFFTTGTAQRGGPALFGDGGGSYLDMRGLGRDRTLVLFDGLRLPPADKRGTVNIDTLPTALLRSVDIVTGGASAAYGADAVGGVTNFILDREFQGLKFQASTGMNDFNSDGKNYNASVAGGMEIGDRINIIGSIETRQIDQFWRDPEELGSWFQRYGWVTNPAYDPADDPGTNPQFLITPWVGTTQHHVNGLFGSGFPFQNFGPPSALSGMRFTDDGSALVPFDGSPGSADSLTNSRTRPGGPSGADVDQTTAFFSIKYAVSDTFELFGDILYGDVETGRDQIYSTAALNFIWSPTLFRENAYLPDSVATRMDEEDRGSIRFARGGSYPGVLDVDNNGRTQTTFDTEMFRIGFDWDIDGNWQMRFSAQTGETKKVTGEFPSLRVDRFNMAIDAVEVYSDMRDVDGDGIVDLIAEADRGTGTIVCNVQRYNPTPAELAATPAIQGVPSSRDPNVQLASPIGLDNSISDCVPFNIMGNGQITQAAADYIMTPKYGIGFVNQDFAELLVTGEVAEGWGAGAISLAAGLTYRDQSFSDEGFPTDVDALGPPFNAPELGIRGIASAWSGASPNLHQFSTVSLISGGYDVWEWFGELNVPVWESDSGDRRLGTSFAYRSSDYSTVGRFDAWKAGVDFQVARDVRLRATKSRDVREATFAERYNYGPGGGRITVDPDPAGGGATNVTITSTEIGNPNLVPEKADTVVLGFVYQPGWAEGLSLSLDRYEVDISDSITTLADDDVVNECYFNMVLCEHVFRTTSGTLTRVNRPYVNLAEAKVRGVDFEVAYSRDVDWFANRDESFSLRVLGGTLDTRTNTVEGSVPDELAGARATPAGTLPELTANITAAYRFGPWNIQLQQRYIDELLLDRNFVEGVDIDNNTVSSQSWTNLVLSREGETTGGGAWRITFNVQNLFDTDPPVIASNPFFAGAAQATDNTHDVWGRRYQLTFNYDL